MPPSLGDTRLLEHRLETNDVRAVGPGAGDLPVDELILAVEGVGSWVERVEDGRHAAHPDPRGTSVFDGRPVLDRLTSIGAGPDEQADLARLDPLFVDAVEIDMALVAATPFHRLRSKHGDRREAAARSRRVVSVPRGWIIEGELARFERLQIGRRAFSEQALAANIARQRDPARHHAHSEDHDRGGRQPPTPHRHRRIRGPHARHHLADQLGRHRGPGGPGGERRLESAIVPGLARSDRRCHRSRASASIAAWRARRAACSRDFTVPVGISRIAASSTIDRPSRWCKTRIER